MNVLSRVYENNKKNVIKNKFEIVACEDITRITRNSNQVNDIIGHLYNFHLDQIMLLLCETRTHEIEKYYYNDDEASDKILENIIITNYDKFNDKFLIA